MRKIELYEITPEELVEMIINELKGGSLSRLEKDYFPDAQILDLNGAMALLGISKTAIYKKTTKRLIPHYKKGRKLYFDKSELIDWIKESKVLMDKDIQREGNSLILKRKRNF